MKELIAVIGTIAIGIAIRFIYDFLVKPAFKKEAASPPPDKNALKSLKKEAKAAKKAAKK